MDYFRHGYIYDEIIRLLREVNGISISLRKLHRFLRINNMYRKSNQSSFEDVITYISKQLQGSGFSIGYRQMHQRCLLNGLRVNRSNVLTIMRELDPEGVELRKRRRLHRRRYFSYGPNWVWHVDGYDKLKP